jgi:hypothetical protein
MYDPLCSSRRCFHLKVRKDKEFIDSMLLVGRELALLQIQEVGWSTLL